MATWNNQGLPSDRMSTENATILCNTERWPLIVDAQLQGIKWIKNKYGSKLKAIRLGQKRCATAAGGGWRGPWARKHTRGGRRAGGSLRADPGPQVDLFSHIWSWEERRQ